MSEKLDAKGLEEIKEWLAREDYRPSRSEGEQLIATLEEAIGLMRSGTWDQIDAFLSRFPAPEVKG